MDGDARTVEDAGVDNADAVDGDEAAMIGASGGVNMVDEVVRGSIEEGREGGGGGEGAEGGECEADGGEMEEEGVEVVGGRLGGHVKEEEGGVGWGEEGEGGAVEEAEAEVGGHDGVGEEVVPPLTERRLHRLELRRRNRLGEDSAEAFASGNEDGRENEDDGEKEEDSKA